MANLAIEEVDFFLGIFYCCKICIKFDILIIFKCMVVTLIIFTMLCYHHHYPFPEFFHHPKQKLSKRIIFLRKTSILSSVSLQSSKIKLHFGVMTTVMTARLVNTLMTIELYNLQG